MAISKELLTKYHKAEPLTDGELSELFHYYDGLRRAFAGYCPPEYRLIEQDVNRQYERCSEMRRARRADKIRESCGVTKIHC